VAVAVGMLYDPQLSSFLASLLAHEWQAALLLAMKDDLTLMCQSISSLHSLNSTSVEIDEEMAQSMDDVDHVLYPM
jgi:hypothetical protein